MREQDNFVKQTLKRVDTCEKQQVAVSNSMSEFEKDCQDLRETEVQMKRDLSAVENVFEKLSKSVDITSDKLANMKEEAEENKKELIKKIEMMIEKNKASGGKIQGRVRALEDFGKNVQRKNDLRLQDLERTIFDRLHLVGQHQQQNVKDFQKNLEKLRKEMLGKVLKKAKDIDNTPCCNCSFNCFCTCSAFCNAAMAIPFGPFSIEANNFSTLSSVFSSRCNSTRISLKLT